MGKNSQLLFSIGTACCGGADAAVDDDDDDDDDDTAFVEADISRFLMCFNIQWIRNKMTHNTNEKSDIQKFLS